MTRAWSLLVAAMVLPAALTAFLTGGVVDAHTSIRSAAPAPGARVSGVVDRAVLEFLDPVVPTPELVVSGPDGEPVEGLGPAELVEDDVVERRFEPLDEPGRYRVDYTYVALDGAEQRGAHEFTYVGDADGGGGPGWRAPAAAVALAGSVVVAIAVLRARVSAPEAAPLGQTAADNQPVEEDP